MKRVTSLLFLAAAFPLTCQAAFNASAVENAVDVVIALNWTWSVKILGSHKSISSFSVGFIKSASEKNIFVEPGAESPRSYQRPALIYYSDDEDDIGQFIEILVDGDYISERLLLITAYELDVPKLDMMQKCGSSRTFLHHEIGSDSRRITRYQTFRQGDALLQNVWERPDDQVFQPVYDFQGSTFTMIGTTNDYPFFYPIPYPNDPTRAYFATGADIDSLDILRAKFNFSLDVFIQTDNNWGLVPVSGELGNSNATYDGIYGAILNDKYDRTSTGFQILLDRYDFFDFSVEHAYFRTHCLMDVDRATKPDWTLYLRPFQKLAWQASFAMVGFVTISYYGVHFFTKSSDQDKRQQCLRMVTFLGWFCFMIVETYYEGALTMFFTTEDKLPFSSIEEGLALYPDFKLLTRQGYETFVVKGVEGGIPGMEQHQQRMKQDPELVQTDPFALLEALRTPGRYTVGNLAEMSAVQAMSPTKDLKLRKLFPTYFNNNFYATMYPKRSPWRAAFNIGYLEMVESGQIEYLVSRLLPKEEADAASSDDDGMERLDLRQTSLVFVVFASLAALAMLIFAFEIVTSSNNKTILP